MAEQLRLKIESSTRWQYALSTKFSIGEPQFPYLQEDDKTCREMLFLCIKGAISYTPASISNTTGNCSKLIFLYLGKVDGFKQLWGTKFE